MSLANLNYLLITYFDANNPLQAMSELKAMFKTVRMKKFIVSYLAPIDATWKTQESTPEEMEAGMKAWMEWAQKCGDNLVDMGSPLGNGITVRPGGKTADGASEMIGYSILQANSMEQALGLLVDHPHLNWNAECEIQVHESLPAPGM